MAKLLIVDDDEAILEMLTQFCRHNGHDIEATNDPRKAIELLRHSDYALPFDLVMTDFNMPVWSGLTLSLHIRNLDRRKGKRTPILCITANMDDVIRLNQRDGRPIDRIIQKGSFDIAGLEVIIQEMIYCPRG